MLFAKSCPRCRGDLTLVFDIDESYFSCVQCGHVTYQRPGVTQVPAVPARHGAGHGSSRESAHTPLRSARGRQAGTARAKRPGAPRGR